MYDRGIVMKKGIILYGVALAICMVYLPFKSLAQSGIADTSLTGLYNSIKSMSDARAMENMAEIVMTKSGLNAPGIQDQCCKYVSAAYAMEGNLEKIVYWLNLCKEPGTKRSGVTEVVLQFLKSGQTDLAQQMLNTKALMTSALNQEQWDALRGQVLFQQGKYVEAVSYLRNEYEKNGRNATQYGIALAKTNQSEKAFEVINDTMLKLRYFNDDFITQARAVFVRKFGNDQRFKTMFDSISLVQHAEVNKKVAKMAVSQVAPDFELKDLNGKAVSLKKLRGKTIFIDFWATWCGPCVGSFPGMQKAVDHFKADSSVVFLFIHSYERVANAPAEVKRYLEAKKYRFDVYMDLQSPVAKSFGVKYLPTKLVIDKNGVVKVRSTGYLSEEEAIDEVSAMIELSRKVGEI